MSGARRTVGDLTYNMTENILAVDTKLMSTLYYLLCAPGKLTKEYMQGRIVSYVHPSKLFWFISLIFFTLLTIRIDYEREQSKAKELTEKTAEKAKSAQDITKVAALDVLDKVNVTSAEDSVKLANIKQRFVNPENSKEAILEKIDKMVAFFKTYAPYVSFFLIPVFALFVQWFFSRKENFYVDYMAFSMHFHAFVFLFFIILIGIDYFFPKLSFSFWLVYVPALYFLRAVWVAFRPKPWRLIWGTGMVVFLYFIAMVTFTALFAVNLAYLAGII